MNMSGGEE